MVFQPR